MDLQRMLHKCQRDQWHVDDLDWSQKPRALSRSDEEAICQLFIDMAAIERLAGALFEEQERRVADPTLKAIFRTFVVDEERHAVVAERLCAHYDVHHYRRYEPKESLRRFAPVFRDAIRHLSDDIANVYITTGEVILDVALLRSIDDYVHDGMSAQAMVLINRDESRHIAIDFAMIEHYASPAYAAAERRRSRAPLRERARTALTFATLIYHAKPFISEVFFQPMALVDPSGRRIREALKRMQALAAKPGVVDRPFGHYLKVIQDTYHRPIVGRLLSGVLSRLSGFEPAYIARLNTEQELARTAEKSFEQLAEEVLAVKYDAAAPPDA